MLEPVNFNGDLFIHDTDGHRIFLDTNDIHMTAHMLENHVWEPHVRQILAASLQGGGVLRRYRCECGASCGICCRFDRK